MDHPTPTRSFSASFSAVCVLAAGLSGGLMAACYWPLEWHWAAWVALVPWLLVLPRLSPSQVWVYGTVLGLVFYRVGLGWLFKIHAPLGGVAIVGLAVLMGFAFRVAALLMVRFGAAAMVWAVPLTFVGQEVLRSEGLPQYRFAYLGWGYSQAHNLWIAQLASIGGVYFLSFLVVAFNASFVLALLRHRVLSCIPVGVIGLLILLLAGASQPSAHEGGQGIPVACVQGENLDYPVYTTLTRRAASDALRPRFIVLPEHTIREFADHRHPFVASLIRTAREYGAYICVGSHARTSAGGPCDYDNVATLIDPNGTLVGSQAKSVPVPFADDGNPARSQQTFNTPFGRAGLYICFDATFTDVPRRLVGLGAEFLLAPLMDPETWPVKQRWLHADMAPFRSIELRRDVVRAASSGISQIVDAAGVVKAQRTREEGPGVLLGTIHSSRSQTIFVRGGYLFGWLIGWAFIALVLVLTVSEWANRIQRRLAEHHDGSKASLRPPRGDDGLL